MRSTTEYVALDVHQSITVASVREAGGRVLARSVLPTEEAAILEFFAGIGRPLRAGTGRVGSLMERAPDQAILP